MLTQYNYKDYSVVCFQHIVTLNSENAQEFKLLLNKQLERSDYQVLLDAKNLEFIDSSGISALISCLKTALQEGGYIYFINLSNQIRKIFELIKLDKMLTIYNTLEHAIGAN